MVYARSISHMHQNDGFSKKLDSIKCVHQCLTQQLHSVGGWMLFGLYKMQRNSCYKLWIISQFDLGNSSPALTKKTSKMSQRDTCCRHLRTCMPKFASLQAFETLWKQLQSKNPMSTETSTLWHLSSHKLKRSCCASPSSAVETIKTTGRNLMLGPRLSTLSPTGPQLPTSNPSLQQLNV